MKNWKKNDFPTAFFNVKYCWSYVGTVQRTIPVYLYQHVSTMPYLSLCLSVTTPLAYAWHCFTVCKIQNIAGELQRLRHFQEVSLIRKRIACHCTFTNWHVFYLKWQSFCDIRSRRRRDVFSVCSWNLNRVNSRFCLHSHY